MENLILNSLQPVLTKASYPPQYGCTKGKGTAKALLQMRADVEKEDSTGLPENIRLGIVEDSGKWKEIFQDEITEEWN